MRLKAPIMFTGFATLSVETQKYFFAPHSFSMSMVLSVLKMFVSIMRMRCKGRKLAVTVAHGRADVTNQLNHVVLADVNDVQNFWIPCKKLTADCRANCPRPSDDEEAGRRDCFRKIRLIYGNITFKQGLSASDEGGGMLSCILCSCIKVM